MRSGAFGRVAPAALAALLSACSSGYSETEAARLLESEYIRSPEVRNLTYPKPGLTCGEVRWLNRSGQYGGWWSFHIKDGHAEVADPPPTAENPSDPPTPFELAHADCIKPVPRRKEGAELIVEGRR